MPTTTDLLSQAIDKNPVDFNDTFNQIMMQKAQDAIEARKIDLAHAIYGDSAEADEDDDFDMDDVELESDGDLEDEEFDLEDLEDLADLDLEDIDLEDLADEDA